MLTNALCLLCLLLQLPPLLAMGIGIATLLVMMLSWRQRMPALLRVLLALAMLAAVFMLMGRHFGRDTGCALLAAMLAIKPAETHSLRDARSLVGFSLFAPFAAFLLDQGPLSMALGLLGTVAGLLTLAQLADNEADAANKPQLTNLSMRQRLLAIGRLVLIGLPLMLSAFWFFPRFASPLWGVPERALARLGLSDEMSPGGWLDLMSDDSPALRVQFFGAVPAPAQRYWRGPVLWDFDGRSWTRPRWTQALPAAATSPGSVHWDYQIEMEPTERRQLVALDLPDAAPAGSTLGRDHGLYAAQPLTSLTRWRMQSSPPRTFEPELPPSWRRRALALPDGFNPRTHALARQWRAELGDDDDAIVKRALEMITGSFAYTLTTPLPGRHAVDEFLFDQKQGYCEHFSSAFVVLMRAAGIPARVVTGYAGGYRNPFGDYWIVRQQDAHAWAEVWLPQRGWVRVDPTAAVAPERIYDTLDDRADVAAGGLGGIPRMGDVGDWLRRGWNDLVLGFDASRQQRMLTGLGLPRLHGRSLALLFAVLALAALGGMAFWLARGERERDPLLRAWHRMNARYARLGLAREPHEPALAWAERIGKARPAEAKLVALLSQRFSELRYAAEVGDRSALIADLHRHRPRNHGEQS